MKNSFLFSMLMLWGSLLYSNDLLEQQLIFPLQPKHVHSSSIVECPNGDFLVCWFHGSGERKANDVQVQGARFSQKTQKWSDVFIMADTPDLPDCNPVLFIDANQKLWLFWLAVRANRWEQSILKYKTSTDYQSEGAPNWSWQDIILLKPGDSFSSDLEKSFHELGMDESMWAEYAPPYFEMIVQAAKDPVKRQTGWMTRIHPFVLPSGRIILPLYSDGFNLSICALSDDNGKTWQASKPIAGAGPTQPSIIRKNDGTLLAYMRDEGDPPYRVQLSQSTDDGMTWTTAHDTEFANPSSSLETTRLSDGKWIMVYNDLEGEGRYRLALSGSTDEGKTWPWKKYLEDDKNGRQSFAYPSMIQAKDGKIHITYSYFITDDQKSIKHVVLDPSWLFK